MSIEAEFDLDKLFLPSWAKESPSLNKYTQHSGEDRERRGRRPDRGERRGPPGGGRGPSDRQAPRNFGAPGGKGFNPPTERRFGPRPDGQRGDRRAGPPRGGGDRRRFDERPAPPPLPEINVTILPDERGVELLAKQIKMTGRAYPIFDIARLVLERAERQQMKFEVVKKDGKIVQPLFLCMLDDSLWLSEQDAVRHVLDKHFETFYKAEQIPTDPPKGVFTFVGQCGMSDVILGPPNYHSYQNNLRKLHQERFSRMPFEAFKARVKIVRDEAVVKKWLEEQSFKTEYTTLNVPEADVKKLQSREELEQHFRTVHLPNIIKEVESHTLPGPTARALTGPISRLARREWDEQQRFPLKLVTYLSQEFAKRGLQFFKVNKQFTHVAVARPHFLDLEATPVSDSIRKIVEFINAHPKGSRRDLVESLAPSPAPAPATPTAEGAPAEAAPAESQQPTPEQTAIISDLHWLVHQGHVIEFANGVLETAKKPNPKPPQQPKKKKEEMLPGTHGETVPDASVEVIEPKVSELEAGRPDEPMDLQQSTITAEAAETLANEPRQPAENVAEGDKPAGTV